MIISESKPFDIIVCAPSDKNGSLVSEFAEAVAKELQEVLGDLDIKIEFVDALRKNRPTEQQKTRRGEDKKKNVAGAFGFDDENDDESDGENKKRDKIKNAKAILVIDDAYDSGETLAEVGRVLREVAAECTLYAFVLSQFADCAKSAKPKTKPSEMNRSQTMTETPTITNEKILWHLLDNYGKEPDKKRPKDYRQKQMELLREAKAKNGEKPILEEFLPSLTEESQYYPYTQLLHDLPAEREELASQLERNGIDIIIGTDGDYPIRIKRSLREVSPILFYSIGETGLFDSPTGKTIAIVGARETRNEALEITKRAARFFAKEGYTLIIGNAEGVDKTAENAALDASANVISVLPQGLLQKKSSDLVKERKDYLYSGKHLIFSELHPNTPWVSWTAMQRNRLIMVMADIALVI